MLITLPTVLTVVLVISTILSPFITALLNIWRDARLKKLDQQHELYKTKYLHERDLIERYLCAAGQFTSYRSTTTLVEYNGVYQSVLFLVPDNLRSKLVEIDSAINRKDFDSSSKLLADVSGELRSYLNTLVFIPPKGKWYTPQR